MWGFLHRVNQGTSGQQGKQASRIGLSALSSPRLICGGIYPVAMEL
jgi:hypothetical protein